MLGSLSAAVSGLDVFQEDMNVIGNNIANSNTNAFKAATVDLGDSFSNTLVAATAGGNTTQVGTGVSIDSIKNNWNTGSLSATNNFNDVAIAGNGFFLVRDASAATSTQYATQDGSFKVDTSGFLVNDSGYRVQGFGASAGVPNTTVGDIQVGAGAQFSVTPSGVVSTNVNGTQTVVGQLVLQNYQDPSALVSVAGNLYSNTANAGPSTLAAPGSGSLGTIQQGYVELSNVDLSGEMANLITAQRGFEANSKIITASDEMLQTVVNMVR